MKTIFVLLLLSLVVNAAFGRSLEEAQDAADGKP